MKSMFILSLLAIFSTVPASIVFENNTIECLPCKFENDLIICFLKTTSADTLSFYTDTGGLNFLYQSGVKKLKLKQKRKDLWGQSKIESLFQQQNYPVPHIKQIQYRKEKTDINDGMLGREWFAGQCWTFDYKNEKLTHIVDFDKARFNQGTPIKMHFKKDSLGNHLTHLGRIELVIDSDSLSFLFDTGAQVKLTDQAQNQLKEERTVATCFINSSIFNAWKLNNPDWVVIESADISFGLNADMILVPKVTIGNQTVDSVWFVEREDFNFQIMSTLFMDEPIVGAIGGNLFSKLDCIVADYRNERLLIME